MDPSIYRLRQQDILTFCVLALLCLGAIMVQSAAMNVTGQLGPQWTPMGMKQVVFCAVGIVAFFMIGRLVVAGDDRAECSCAGAGGGDYEERGAAVVAAGVHAVAAERVGEVGGGF